jgi:uncharacterized protein (TIGR02246 family)
MPLPVEDILAIHDLVARYCHACDSGDGEAYADVFTEDGIMAAPPSLEAKGREELAMVAISAAQGNVAPRHLVSSLLIDGEGDRATLRAYCEFVAIVGESRSHQVLSSGIYHDDLVKVNGQWKFARRNFVLDA